MTRTLIAVAALCGMLAPAHADPTAHSVQVYHLKATAHEEIIDGVVESRACVAGFCELLNVAGQVPATNYVKFSEPEGWLIQDDDKLFIVAVPDMTSPPVVWLFSARALDWKGREPKLGDKVKVVSMLHQKGGGLAWSPAGFAALKEIRGATKPPPKSPTSDVP